MQQDVVIWTTEGALAELTKSDGSAGYQFGVVGKEDY